MSNDFLFESHVKRSDNVCMNSNHDALKFNNLKPSLKKQPTYLPNSSVKSSVISEKVYLDQVCRCKFVSGNIQPVLQRTA